MSRFPNQGNTTRHYLQRDKAQGIRSTKPPITGFEAVVASLTVDKKEKNMYLKVYNVQDLHHTVYSDKTRRFPYHFHSGNHYVIIMFEVDSSWVLIEAMKSKKDE
ncbi:hypothetical protein ACHAWF_004177 [Thalassiosira exigua]